jgi:hypothetical protein
MEGDTLILSGLDLDMERMGVSLTEGDLDRLMLQYGTNDL